MLLLRRSCERIVGLQSLDLLLELVQLNLRRHVILSVRTIFFLSNEVLLLFNNLPEEIIAECSFKLGVELGIVR